MRWSLFGWLAISLSAWLVGSLLSVQYFHQIPLWGWLNTLLLVPLIWVTLVLGFAKAMLALISPALAGVIGGGYSSDVDILADRHATLHRAAAEFA